MKMTIREAQTWASSFLAKQNIEQAELEAEIMIRSLFGWDRSQLFVHWNESMPMSRLEQFKQWLNRRINHEPIQYIIGTQEFFGREFQVNSSVLIPRPETELLIEEVLQQAEQIWQDQPITVVDIGTGSGAIAITLSLEKPNWNVHTVDISKQALQVAKRNAERLGAKLIFHHGNLLEPIIRQKMKVDLVISNPPYIPSRDIQTLMPEVKNYEPILALDGGEDGLVFYRQIISQSFSVLKRLGMIAFEIGTDQSEAIQQLFANSGAKSYQVLPDFQGIPRVAMAWFKD
ncbi:peptide chain release factor N(5)-glutamine methyltransferase [Tepidibacillus fermentans]|uniref:Release factor glutamine methyltransferase n=1 Tax=Tepidibacillus fermentans TaxID=1281767 RepID=A0A4R3K5M5_9BACI|nr:peptide chain release factor N(5)-glutamine methyltransferase [Tepidibacillus fermentans]TCS78030.1 release factor glutamine methyltransferase [Tepidibacillus fermentans]